MEGTCPCHGRAPCRGLSLCPCLSAFGLSCRCLSPACCDPSLDRHAGPLLRHRRASVSNIMVPEASLARSMNSTAFDLAWAPDHNAISSWVFRLTATAAI